MDITLLVKQSLDKALMKAKSHVNNNELIEAKKIYRLILQTFPENLTAHQGLAALNKHKQDNALQRIPQETLDQLVNLYNQGQFSKVVEQAQDLTKQYPNTFIIWNIIGASTAQIGKLDEAIEAFKKLISLKPDYPDAYYNMGIAFKDQGKICEAIEVFKKAISLKPDYPEAYHNMGIALKDQGKLDAAIEAYSKSIALKPDYAIAYNNLGLTFHDQGKLDEAIDAFKKAISLKPNYVIAYSNKSNALKAQGKIDEAIKVLKKVISLKPDYPEAYYNMGIAFKDQGKLDAAIEAYSKSIALKPDYAIAYSKMGIALKDQGKLDKAIEAFKKVISLKPDHHEGYYNIGLTFHDQDKLDEAIEAYSKSIELKPDYFDAYSNLAVALGVQGKLDKAIVAFKKAISLKPDYPEGYYNMGLTFHNQDKLDKAIEAYKTAISVKPDYADAHMNLGLTLLNSGKLKEGLDKYEWRWKTKEFLKKKRHFYQPLWDKEKSLNGKRILLWSEQGIGDTLTWSSYLSHVTSQAKHCILECQEKLIPLLERSFPNVQVKAVNKSLDLERNDFDFHLPMGSLYKHFIYEIEQNTKINAHLIPDPVRVDFWKKRLNSLGSGPYIGICWKSSNISTIRRPNYATISELYPVLKLPDVTYVNLQYTDFTNDLTKIKKELGLTIHNFDDLDHFNNVDDVAALCAALDMVVSTKTTVPLISAGVGTLTKVANWKQSPWNNILLNPIGPSVDIFERDMWEPWDNVFSSIAEDIFTITKNWSS